MQRGHAVLVPGLHGRTGIKQELGNAGLRDKEQNGFARGIPRMDRKTVMDKNREWMDEE